MDFIKTYNGIMRALRIGMLSSAKESLLIFIEEAENALITRGWDRFPFSGNKEVDELIKKTDKFLTGPRQ